MKVFLSWSGERSRNAAVLFRDWLPHVIQALDPWVSTVDLAKGARWFTEVARELSTASFGIIFLTPENAEAPWLHFEAGALARALPGSDDAPKVCTYLIGLEHAQLRGPLSEFQNASSTEQDTRALVGSLNDSLAGAGEKPIATDIIEEAFQLRWPSLAESLGELGRTAPPPPPKRPSESILEEILEYVRPRAHRPGVSTSAPPAVEMLIPGTLRAAPTVQFTADVVEALRSAGVAATSSKPATPPPRRDAPKRRPGRRS